MKCSKCNSEMEKGRLVANGTTWVNEKSGIFKKLFLGSYPIYGKKVYAYKCKECGKLELYVEDNNK